MHSHHIDHANSNKIYFVARSGIPDETLYIIKSDVKEKLNRTDKKKLNQYDATQQSKSLYDQEFSLLEILDKRTNNTSKRYCMTWDKQEITLYLTKRSNGIKTTFAWETEL